MFVPLASLVQRCRRSGRATRLQGQDDIAEKMSQGLKREEAEEATSSLLQMVKASVYDFMTLTASWRDTIPWASSWTQIESAPCILGGSSSFWSSSLFSSSATLLSHSEWHNQFKAIWDPLVDYLDGIRSIDRLVLYANWLLGDWLVTLVALVTLPPVFVVSTFMSSLV